MGKRILFFAIVLIALSGARIVRASTVAPRHRDRCSQTTGAFLQRLAGDRVTSDEFLADASHLLPHVDLGYAPVAVKASNHGLVLSDFRHGAFALKPSLSLCRFEAHLVAEFTFGSERAKNFDELKRVTRPTPSFGWRFGAEVYTRPARWFPESWRYFDSIALGMGATAGGIMAHEQPHVTLDHVLEIGPRLLFDANEWLAFVLSANLHLRPFEMPEYGFVLSGGIQLSFPSHTVFAHDH